MLESRNEREGGGGGFASRRAYIQKWTRDFCKDGDVPAAAGGLTAALAVVRTLVGVVPCAAPQSRRAQCQPQVPQITAEFAMPAVLCRSAQEARWGSNTGVAPQICTGTSYDKIDMHLSGTAQGVHHNPVGLLHLASPQGSQTHSFVNKRQNRLGWAGLG